MGWTQDSSALGRVLIDINTQWDFLSPDGILPVRNLVLLLPVLRRTFALARSRRIPVISAMEAHRPSEPPNGLPPHCIDGTFGQHKLPFTLLTPRITVHADNNFDLPFDLMRRYRQVIFRKQDQDLFANPKADRLLTELTPSEYIVFGVGVERSIKAVALGLLARHKRVAVLTDACGYWSEADADLAWRQLRAKGITLMLLDELAASESLPRRRPVRPVRLSPRHHPSPRGLRCLRPRETSHRQE